AQPLRPSATVPDVDRHLERVVLKALAENPEDRPASATAMAESLPPAPGVAAGRPRPPLEGAPAGGAGAAVVPGAESRRGAVRGGARRPGAGFPAAAAPHAGADWAGRDRDRGLREHDGRP